MLKNLALLASLGANLVLLALSLLGSGATAASTSPALPGERAPHTHRGLEDPSAYYRALKALGLDEHEARLLLGARLEERAVAQLSAPPDRYWEPRQAGLARYAEDAAAAHAVVREELVLVLGSSAERAPELARSFRPLSPRLEFLSSKEQVALQLWRLRHPPNAVPAGRGGPVQALAGDAAGGELAQLREVLPAGAAFEVAVRESALAEQIRMSGAKFGESEFRETYTLMADTETGRDIEAQLAQRRRLRSLLGADRFDRVWSIRDPLAAIVRDTSRERGLDEADALRAYGVLNASQERLTELGLSGDLKSERTVAAAQAIASQEQADLARVVGEENARAILSARSAYFVALSRAAQRAGAPPAQ
ncbi:MAG TPA: hypothetical protein VFX89_03725 [Gammaproteobacteria bacterium]|nr:hypothetical protein [Gammaproteobacteria bacterium]